MIWGDGNQTRDFTYVGSAVLANLLACEASSVACGRTYNIAGGRKISINDLFYSLRALIAEKKSGAGKIEPKYEAARPGDVRESLAEISQAKKRLKFQSRIPLVEGLQKTVVSFLEFSAEGG